MSKIIYVVSGKQYKDGTSEITLKSMEVIERSKDKYEEVETDKTVTDETFEIFDTLAEAIGELERQADTE